MASKIERISIKNAYWICQTIGWSVYATNSIVMTSMVTGGFQNLYLYTHLSTTLTYFFITHWSRVWLRRRIIPKNGLYKILATMGVFVIVATLIGAIIVICICALFIQIPNWSDILTMALSTAITFASWISLYAGFKIFLNYRKNETEKWKLEAKLLKAEISALKAQINPHFVFNALNNIRSLISESPKKARTAITTLSKLLRISLRSEEELVIPLSKELKIVKEYLYLESLHLEDRLRVFWKLTPIDNRYLIPALGIQTLVENALKHGISTNPDGGTIKIATKEEDDKLRICVFNTGQFLEKNFRGENNGTGLENLRKRLKLFDKKSQFRIEQCSDNTVKAEIIIHSHENTNS